LAHYLFKHDPRVYALTVEKNGQDFLVSEEIPLEVTSRDEFAIKSIVSDALSDKGFTVDVLEGGGENDYRILLRGIDLVDQWSDKFSPDDMKQGYRQGSIHVFYHGKPVAVFPLHILLLPQDWLRYAKAANNPEERINYLRAAAKANPEDLGIKRVLVELYLERGKNKEAIAELQAIIEKKPDDEKSLLTLMNLCLTTKQNDMAVKTGLAAIAIMPEEPAFWEGLILAYSRLGSWQKAADASEELLKINPQHSSARLALAEIYAKMGREIDAAAQYRMAGKSSGGSSPLESLALSCIQKGKYAEAIQILNDLAKEPSPPASVYANLGLAYGGQKMWKEELANYRKAASIRPNDPVILYNLAVSLENNNQTREAMSTYEKVLKVKPGDTEAMTKLADMAFRAKQYKKAADLYEKLVVKVPQKAGIYANMGYAYGELNQLSQSAKAYERAIKAGSKDEKVRHNLAATYEKMGKGKSGTPAPSAVSGKATPQQSAVNATAEGYVKKKQYDAAINLYRSQLKKDPQNGGIYREIGKIYEKKGSLEEALNAYLRAYQLNSDDREAEERIPQLRIRMIKEKREKQENEKG
jgi:tetratricopeptide (TPR) repeat protein